MADSFSWVTLLPAIGFGGLIAAIVTAFVNYIVKEREFYIDISNQKINAISKSKPHVFQLSRYYILLSQQLRYAITYIHRIKDRYVYIADTMGNLLFGDIFTSPYDYKKTFSEIFDLRLGR
jgi:hypothetical protein